VTDRVAKLPEWAVSVEGFVALSAAPRRTRPKTIQDESGITYRKANLKNARPFEWSWQERILRGYLNLLVGIEGIGKGNLVAWILARITRGELPGNLYGAPRRIAIAGDEDSFENIWVPRLHMAGANLENVRYIVSGANGTLDVHEDANALRKFIKRQELAVVYLDQLLDNLGFVDTWKEKQVRDALAPLRTVARETNVSLLVTMHPNKRQGTFRERVSGSPAFNAMSRSSLLVTGHPHEPGRTVVVRAKGNYSKEPPAFEFRIEQCELVNGEHLITTSRIANIRETELRANDVLEAPTRRREESKAGIARRALAELFADGEPRPAAEAQELLYRQYGINSRTTTEAAKELAFQKWQEGYQGPWWWRAGTGGESASN
jgi:hypothetical protein